MTDAGIGLGHRAEVVRFHNLGTTTCSPQGYPTWSPACGQTLLASVPPPPVDRGTP